MALDQSAIRREIIVSGEVDGDITVEAGAKLVIQDGASVNGNIHVAAGATAFIEGEVDGDVLAEGDLYVREGGVVNGSITAIKRVT
jgi:cytoskeletal protein CcmA (bactofilin family)